MARFEEVSTSEYVIQESDKYLDLLSIVKKENLDENGIIERLSNIPISTLEEIERRTIGQNENALENRKTISHCQFKFSANI